MLGKLHVLIHSDISADERRDEELNMEMNSFTNQVYIHLRVLAAQAHRNSSPSGNKPWEWQWFQGSENNQGRLTEGCLPSEKPFQPPCNRVFTIYIPSLLLVVLQISHISSSRQGIMIINIRLPQRNIVSLNYLIFPLCYISTRHHPHFTDGEIDAEGLSTLPCQPRVSRPWVC